MCILVIFHTLFIDILTIIALRDAEQNNLRTKKGSNLALVTKISKGPFLTNSRLRT